MTIGLDFNYVAAPVDIACGVPDSIKHAVSRFNHGDERGWDGMKAVLLGNVAKDAKRGQCYPFTNAVAKAFYDLGFQFENQLQCVRVVRTWPRRAFIYWCARMFSTYGGKPEIVMRMIRGIRVTEVRMRMKTQAGMATDLSPQLHAWIMASEAILCSSSQRPYYLFSDTIRPDMISKLSTLGRTGCVPFTIESVRRRGTNFRRAALFRMDRNELIDFLIHNKEYSGWDKALVQSARSL